MEIQQPDAMGERVSRRNVLRGGAAVLAASAMPQSVAQPARTPPRDAIYFASVADIAARIGRGELSSEEVVTACIDRIEAVNPALNAVVQMTPDAALARAREADAARARGVSWGPLHGVPMTIKDSFDTAGVVSSGGTLGRARFVPQRDATVVARLRGAGAILLGKTNTPELTLSFETDNLVYGRTANPYDLDRSPGGSSGGAAAIVAAGGAPFDIGSDYGGSIRAPAHFCGIAGLKPTAGRVPRTGHVFPFGGIQDAYQQIGPLARYVDDLALLLPLIAGPDFIDPGVTAQPLADPRRVELASLRIAFHSDNGVLAADADVAEAVTVAARALEPDVRAVEERRPPGAERGVEIGFGLTMWDGGSAVRRLLEEAGTERHTLAPLMGGTALDAEQLGRLIADWYAWRSTMLAFLAEWDVILCPVTASCAPRHGFMAEPNALLSFGYSMTYNATGWPAAVVRVGTSAEGLPIGVQIVAAPSREDVALAVAKHVESALGGFRPPPG